MISHLMLTKTETLSQSVSLQIDNNRLPFLVIAHEKVTAVFSLHGGHLIHFQSAQQEPLIWLSKNAIFNGSKAIRGGVPICWPWFGTPKPSLGEKLPAHGFARNSEWTLTSIEESSQGVALELTLSSSEATLALWPYQFELTLKATLNDQLTLQLVTENKDNKPFSYTGALHTYLNISEPESIHLSGLSEQFYNSLNNNQLESGDTKLLIDRPIDAVYKKSAGDIQLNDKQFKRTLVMTNTGNDSEVLWTPWREGAKAFVDMPDDGYQTMFCIESAITQGNGRQINIGEQHTLTSTIKQFSYKQ